MAKVMYLHGLESGPNAGKAVALRNAGFEVEAPQLDTAAPLALYQAKSQDPTAWADAFVTPVGQAKEVMLAFRPDVIVGSSFGAAVLLRLMHSPAWTGAQAILLAGAGPKMTGIRTLPPDVDVLLLHGRQDEIIPIDDSRRLAETSGRAILIEVHDDHRLTQTTATGLLCAIVRLALTRR